MLLFNTALDGTELCDAQEFLSCMVAGRGTGQHNVYCPFCVKILVVNVNTNVMFLS